MKYIILLLFTLILILLFQTCRKEGFKSCKINETDYPNSYDDEAKNINKRYVENRGALVDYYNSRSFDFNKIATDMRLPYSPVNIEHKNTHSTIKADNYPQDERTYDILDKMDTILTKMIKDQELNTQDYRLIPKPQNKSTDLKPSLLPPLPPPPH
jgi:hypothetical protein